MKRIFVISVISLFITSIFWGVYVFFLKSTDDSSKNEVLVDDNIHVEEEGESKKEENSEQNKEEYSISKKILFNVTELSVIEADFDVGNDDVIRYVTKDGYIMKITTRGTNNQKIFKLDVPKILDAKWSFTNDDLILFTEEGLYLYRDMDKNVVKLDDFVDYAEWTSIENKIVYKYFDSNLMKRFIKISDFSEGEDKKVAEIDYRKVSFYQAPNSFELYFWQTPNSFVSSEFSKVNVLVPYKPDVVYSGLYGADYLFSPSGKKILVSSVTQKGGYLMTLAVMNDKGGEYTNLKVPTMISKCVWGSDDKTVYYALPSDISRNSIMPNDYNNKLFFTRDTFWKIDITTGKKKRLINLNELTEKIDADKMFISNNEDSLYFINRINGLLYRLKLT